MILTFLKWSKKMAERYRAPRWIPAAPKRVVANLMQHLKRRFHVRVAKRAISGRLANLDDVEHFLCERHVPLHVPLLLVSQAQRSGGSLLSQLFDGHPELAAYPQELRFGYKVRDQWPPLDTGKGAHANFVLLFDHNFPRIVRRGLTKGYRNPERHPFLLITRVEYAVFKRMWEEEPPKNQRDIMDYFFTAFFNSWLNYQGNLEQKKWITAFAPRLAREEASIRKYFETYPDGRLVQIVRDPMTWYPSTKNHAKTGAARIGPEKILSKWSRSTESILRNKRQFGEQVTILRFEDLVGRTEQTMRQLSNELGVPYDSALLEPTFNLHPMRANSSFDVGTTGIIESPLLREKMLTDDERRFLERRCSALHESALAEATPIGDGAR